MLICATIIYAILHGDILNPFLQLKETSTEEELRKLIDEKFSFRFDCGVFQPTSQLKLRDKEHIIASISMHFCVYSCKVELDEMRRGLLSLNFIGAMNGNPSLKALFKFNAEAQTLTAEEVEKLFVPLFSPQGSNKRSKEEQVMMHFLEFLQDLEGEYYS